MRNETPCRVGRGAIIFRIIFAIISALVRSCTEDYGKDYGKDEGEGVSGVACRTAWVVEELTGRGMTEGTAHWVGRGAIIFRIIFAIISALVRSCTEDYGKDYGKDEGGGSVGCRTTWVVEELVGRGMTE